jgi:ParB family chromosome partitioning protein
MNTTVINATEYRDLPLAMLTESANNPRRTFADAALKELATSIRTQGVLSPLSVRPLNERSFEIVAGARRYRAAKMAEVATVPVRIVNLTDAEALEMALVENLIRADIHPMEEANGLRALLMLEEPKYTIEQLAAKIGKTPSFVASRVRLTELVAPVVEAFYAEEIGVGHALLLAKLQPAQQEQALPNCFRDEWGGGTGKSKRILLPVRHLQHWIEHNVLLLLRQAPFNKRDAQLVPAAGSCVDCPKRTGHNKLLFADVTESNSDACTDPNCHAAKVEAHVQKQVAAKPALVQISTAYGQQKEGSATLPRNKYVEVRPDKPSSKEEASRPEFKTCKYIAEAIVSEGIDKGELRKVCTEPTCSVHHAKTCSQKESDDPKAKAQQERQRREIAIANTIGIRTLAAIAEAVPVRLMKRDLLFIAERLVSLLDENRLSIVARRYGIKKAKASDSLGKLFAAYLRRAEESVLGSVLVETTILSTNTRHNPAQVLSEAAVLYKVDTDAIALKVKQEFAAKEKTQAAKKAVARSQPKAEKKTKAA